MSSNRASILHSPTNTSSAANSSFGCIMGQCSWAGTRWSPCRQ
jgi:hypothetical protein